VPHDVFGIIMGMIVAAILIAVCIVVLVRTSGASGKRVAGPPLPGDELTEHERGTALENLTTLNQWETLRENQRSFPG
jgi:hypothetical protein